MRAKGENAAGLERPRIIRDDPPPYCDLDTETATWPSDPNAMVRFARAYDTCYVIELNRGEHWSGSDILRHLRTRLAPRFQIKVVGVTNETVGFYQKMVERGMITEFTEEDVETFFDSY